MTQEGQALGEDATEEAGLELGPEKDKLGKERPEHSGRDWGSKSWRGMKCKSGSNEYTNRADIHVGKQDSTSQTAGRCKLTLLRTWDKGEFSAGSAAKV